MSPYLVLLEIHTGRLTIAAMFNAQAINAPLTIWDQLVVLGAPEARECKRRAGRHADAPAYRLACLIVRLVETTRSWYACACGHRERIWNSRDGVTPFCIPCPSCGASALQHADLSRDEVRPLHTPHEGQRVFVDMARDEAEHIVERAFIRLGLNRAHPKFAPSVDELLGHTTGESPLVAIAGDVACYVPHDEFPHAR